MPNLENQELERSNAVKAILESTSKHRVVVAGPGTGKTFLFEKICEIAAGDILAITFINNLANDLTRALGNLAECCTFHALCKKLIYQLPVPTIYKYVYFPKIGTVLNSDKEILEPEYGDLREAFEQFMPDDVRVNFFLRRAHYYKSVGHTDGVFQVVQFLLANPEKIPAYSQILVDEYQDFNRLEVKMIEVLAKSSPTIVVGDDDQALYDFKYATPHFLRTLAKNEEYELFSLPYCSRCTEVIVDATNQLVKNATNAGLLQGRINKPFTCFKPSKKDDSANFPKLIHVTCSVHMKNAPYVVRFLCSEIEHIVKAGYQPDYDPGVWDFIIAGPKHYLRGLADLLSEKFPNTFHSRSVREDLRPSDCYSELIEHSDSDIAWRSVLTFYEEGLLNKLVRESKSMETPFRQLVPETVRQDVRYTLEILAKLKEGKSLDAFEETRLIEVFDQSVDSTSRELGFKDESDKQSPSGPGHTIRISSLLGCKGLTGNFVFIIGVDNGMLPNDPIAPTDFEICKLIVGITRARKKCYLVSVNRFLGKRCYPSVFLDWIDSSLMENVYVNKDYFA